MLHSKLTRKTIKQKQKGASANMVGYKQYTGDEFVDNVQTILNEIDNPTLVRLDENGIFVPHPLFQMTNKELNDGQIGIVTREKVYKIPTLNPFKIIIIYSSVEESTNKSRDCGEDRVRLVLRLKTKGKFHYWHLDHRNRIETLFDNLKESINDGLIRSNGYWEIGGNDYIPDLKELNTRMD